MRVGVGDSGGVKRALNPRARLPEGAGMRQHRVRQRSRCRHAHLLLHEWVGAARKKGANSLCCCGCPLLQPPNAPHGLAHCLCGALPHYALHGVTWRGIVCRHAQAYAGHREKPQKQLPRMVSPPCPPGRPLDQLGEYDSPIASRTDAPFRLPSNTAGAALALSLPLALALACCCCWGAAAQAAPGGDGWRGRAAASATASGDWATRPGNRVDRGPARRGAAHILFSRPRPLPTTTTTTTHQQDMASECVGEGREWSGWCVFRGRGALSMEGHAQLPRPGCCIRSSHSSSTQQPLAAAGASGCGVLRAHTFRAQQRAGA